MKRLALLLALSLTAFSQETLTRLLRQPDIHGDKVVFVYAGDLWLASTSGGEARRLTADDGIELFPKFSPDGKWIAFCGEYSGTRQVYVISAEGGTPRQLTFYNDAGPLPPRGGIDNRVLDWTPDGKSILFLSHRVAQSDRLARPYIVPAGGGMEQPLPMPMGGGGAFSPDGTKLVYTPWDREFRTWKRYRGGRAQDVWIYDLVKNTAEQITNDPMTDNQPVWIGDAIYFTSDREGGKLNLWSYDLKTKQTKKVTNHTDFDVLWPSSDDAQVVYECGGYLWRYDTRSGKEERIPIRVVGDFRGALPYFKNVRGNIEDAFVSPTGARALLVARGELFTVPAKNGEIRNLTQSPGVRERDAAWSPDGKTIAYLSDRNGDEYELYLRPADGTGSERQLTKGSKAWNLAPKWSPDSKLIAYADKEHTLHVIDVATGKITDVDKGKFEDITTYVWSPDSRWIAYVKANRARFNEIWVYSVPDAKSARLTGGMTSDSDPAFDPKGRYLYFTSNRDFNLTFSAFEFNYVYTDPTRVYAGVLAADGPALFLPQSDEEKAAAAPAPEEKKDEKKEAKKADAVKVNIDFAGFESRVRAIPVSSGNYRQLDAVANGVLYLSGTGAKTQLNLYDIDDRKEETVVDGNVRGYDLSADHEKVLVRSGETYAIVAAKPGQKISDALNLDHLEMKIDPRAEWAQEFTDAWRILRDWFYDPKMHGNDWNAVRAQYAPLVPWVAHRFDLDYVLGELAGEVGAGHVYVQSPSDLDPAPRMESGLLGAEIVAADGVFRIAKIYPGENWHESRRSPLTEPGVKAKEGEYILAVDGVSARGVDNFYRLLENKGRRVVTLTLAASADGTGSHEEKVRTITNETNVRYLDWVASRRAYVDKVSGGRIGYIHLPDTAGEGNRELFRYFYPQIGKDALIIDDRFNGGGFIPDRMIELLDRPLLNYWVRRNLEPAMTPAYAHEGPKAILTNGLAGSGGDALPYYFRERKLGPVIGTRTWGGLIGLSGSPDLMDGGGVTVPTFRFKDTHGMWAVEGVGTAPDIEVVDRPDLVAAGHDPTLEKAVEVLMQELKERGRPRPQ